MANAEPTPHKHIPGSSIQDPTHLNELLRRAASSYSHLIAQLHDCERQTAALIDDRATRAWSDAEHGTYLRLRHREQQLRRRIRRSRRVFDQVRIRLRDLEDRP